MLVALVVVVVVVIMESRFCDCRDGFVMREGDALAILLLVGFEYNVALFFLSPFMREAAATVAAVDLVVVMLLLLPRKDCSNNRSLTMIRLCLLSFLPSSDPMLVAVVIAERRRFSFSCLPQRIALRSFSR
jgi:hypothetical protein